MSDPTAGTPPKADPILTFKRTDGFVRAEVTDCGHCNKGSVIDDSGEYSVAKPCPRCRPFNLQATALNRARLPVEPAGANLRAFQVDRPGDPPGFDRGDGVLVVHTTEGTIPHPAHYRRQALDAALAFCDALIAAPDKLEELTGLLFAGPPGTGKSHLLIGMCRRLCLQAPRVFIRYASVTEVMAECRRSMQAQRETQKGIDELVDVPVLALDELGKGRATDWEISTADEILTRRYEAGRVTLIATNYSLERDPSPDDFDALTNRIGPRAFSRLMHKHRSLPLIGNDQRFEGRA